MEPNINYSKKLAVIGGGRMGEAIMSGLFASGYVAADEVVVVEPVAARREELASRHGVDAVAAAHEAAATASTLILAIKPQDANSVLNEIDSIIQQDQLLISIVAGLTTKSLESKLPHGSRVLRAMPNTPALVGSGVTAVCGGLHTDDADVETGLQILGKVGVAIKVKEELMDAVTAVSGSGPAYFFLFVEALIEAGVRSGLPRDVATTLVIETMAGSAKLLQETGTHPAILREMVTSPGGTTAAGVAALENRAIRSAAIEAINAATQRSKELGG